MQYAYVATLIYIYILFIVVIIHVGEQFRNTYTNTYTCTGRYVIYIINIKYMGTNIYLLCNNECTHTCIVLWMCTHTHTGRLEQHLLL